MATTTQHKPTTSQNASETIRIAKGKWQNGTRPAETPSGLSSLTFGLRCHRGASCAKQYLLVSCSFRLCVLLFTPAVLVACLPTVLPSTCCTNQLCGGRMGDTVWAIVGKNKKPRSKLRDAQGAKITINYFSHILLNKRSRTFFVSMPPEPAIWQVPEISSSLLVKKCNQNNQKPVLFYTS